jgi:hypothetical protein
MKISELFEASITAYHGTNRDFDTFKRNPNDVMHADDSSFFHFGNKKQAQQRLADKEDCDNARIIQAKLDIKNPLRMKDITDWDPWNIVYELRNSKNKKIAAIASKTFEEAQQIGKRKQWNFDKKMREWYKINGGFKQSIRTKEEMDYRKSIIQPYENRLYELVKNMFSSLGYDAIVYKNKYEGSGDSYLVFEPHQIKIVKSTPIKQ